VGLALQEDNCYVLERAMGGSDNFFVDAWWQLWEQGSDLDQEAQMFFE